MQYRQRNYLINPVINITRLGPLKETRVNIANLTLLTGPPGQGKTYILNAIFSELLPADLDLVAACFFRGRWGDKLRVAQTLYTEKIIEITLNKIDVNKEKGELKIGEFRICVNPTKAKNKLAKCLEGWLYPANSKFIFKLFKGKKKLITNISKTLEAALIKSGYEKYKNNKLCIKTSDISISEKSLNKSNKRKIIKLAEILSTINEFDEYYMNWLLAAALLSPEFSQKNEKLAILYNILKKVEIEFRAVYEKVLAPYRPVYSWMGRGLIALAATEPDLSDIIEVSTFTGLGLGAFLPVYSMAKSVREGLRLLDTPEVPKEIGLLLELARPAILHDLKSEKGRLVFIVGDVAIPFRLAHGSAISLVGLILGASPLIKNHGGYLLIDEAEHLLHPSAQAIMGLVLLGIAATGVRVVATTHSTGITTVIAKMAKVATKKDQEAVIKEAERLYEMLGYNPPRKEALELVARGAAAKPLIYVVDQGKAYAIKNPLEWIDKLTDAWFSIASWASNDN